MNARTRAAYLARTGSSGQAGEERARSPPSRSLRTVQGDVVHVDATFGEELLEVPVRQPIPQVPAHRCQGSPPAGSGTRRTPTRQSPADSIHCWASLSHPRRRQATRQRNSAPEIRQAPHPPTPRTTNRDRGTPSPPSRTASLTRPPRPRNSRTASRTLPASSGSPHE